MEDPIFKLSRSMLVFLLPVAMLTLAPMVAEAEPASFPITVGKTGALLDPTLVRVPTEFTCAPMEVDFPQVGAQLKQAVSGKVAFGSGYTDDPIICDGTPHTVDFLIWVDTASPAPFRRGNATVLVGAFLCPPAPTPTDACQSGSSGI